MKLSIVSTAVAALALLGSAQAATYTYTGDTTDAATFDRPYASFSGLSALGQGVNYDALSFTVTASGSYTFLSVADGWDNFTFLYSPSFDPTHPLLNGKIGNDDQGGIGRSGFSYTLTAGTAYVLVTTGFEGGVDFGSYTNTITGAGSVLTVPEPATYGLMALGLALVGGLARRRHAQA